MYNVYTSNIYMNVILCTLLFLKGVNYINKKIINIIYLLIGYLSNILFIASQIKI